MSDEFSLTTRTFTTYSACEDPTVGVSGGHVTAGMVCAQCEKLAARVELAERNAAWRARDLAVAEATIAELRKDHR